MEGPAPEHRRSGPHGKQSVLVLGSKDGGQRRNEDESRGTEKIVGRVGQKRAWWGSKTLTSQQISRHRGHAGSFSHALAGAGPDGNWEIPELEEECMQ